MFLCVLCCGMIQVCEHAVSHFVRGLILCSMCHSVSLPSEEPQPLEVKLETVKKKKCMN